MTDIEDVTKLTMDPHPSNIELLESNCSRLEAKLNHTPTSADNVVLSEVSFGSAPGVTKCYDMVYGRFSGRVIVSHDSILFHDPVAYMSTIINSTHSTSVYSCPLTTVPMLDRRERVSGEVSDLVDAFIELFPL